MESILRPTKDLIGALRSAEDSVDLSCIDFTYPIMILPIAALVSEKSIDFTLPKNKNCAEYMKYFNFPNGSTEFKLSSKYIPICKFFATKNDQVALAKKSKILKNLIGICLDKLGSPGGSVNALTLSIYEIISNIEDHSAAKYGWINAQYYPKKKYLDVCIADRGITINGRYKEAGKYLKNDQEALKSALSGESVKPEIIRGSGLPTFIKMITGGFKGEIVIISGDAIAYANKDKSPVIKKLTVRWDGTVVAFRVPKNMKRIDYAQYID